MSSPQVIQSLASLGSQAGQHARRQANTWRDRLLTTDKSRRRAQIVQTSFAVHRPVWITAGGAAYTTAAAVLLTLRAMKRLR
ncbi:hypothetical protein BDV28DRAFT_144753 [Aspergillus coremiiformis]|uniref:Uncharacterized protein n=1 Tax=Aspergillus coremiiformis TaxID=138285 RepID=A0A5N6ZJ69_9EURO|nr:hypothetical protein BDV28DRAFT_144753 [Aspergillus coremiiformis]